MKKRIALLLGTAMLVAVGAAMFAAYESHLIDVKAHVEKATYVSPSEVDFGTALMQATYDKTMTIHLSDSFLTQTTFTNAEYSIYCDEKPQAESAHDGNITPFIVLTGPDGVPHNGCGTVGVGTITPPVFWADGNPLIKGVGGNAAVWHLKLYAPVCSDNYNVDTDPIKPADQPVPLTIDGTLCHKGAGGDSDEYVDLASNIKFQITRFSTGG
jgi:hypothetical protein